MTKDHEYLYPYSAQEAKKRNQLPMWRESYHANVACRNAIEETIRQNFDGMHLKKDCLEPVLAEYGYKRTEWVLATTLQELSWDGRFSRANKQWAARRYIPQDERHNAEITVRSHPAILDAFVDLYREAYQKLGLFGPEHCVGDRAEQDYIGKVLVLSPDTLKESFWSQENQLWYAHDGFGCSPHAIGRSVRCTCLSDGETTRWNRDEFVGVLDEKFLPAWAKESLSQFQQEEVLLCKQAAKNFHTICKKETALKRVLSNLLSAVSLLRFKAVFSCGFRVPPGSGLYQSCAAGSVCIPAGQKYCSPRPRKSCPADRKTPGLPSRCIGHRW